MAEVLDHDTPLPSMWLIKVKDELAAAIDGAEPTELVGEFIEESYGDLNARGQYKDKVGSIEITEKLATTFQQTLEPIGFTKGEDAKNAALEPRAKRPRLGKLQKVIGPNMAIFTQAAAEEEGGDPSFKIVGHVARQCTLDYVYPDGETEAAIQKDRIFAMHSQSTNETKLNDPRTHKIRQKKPKPGAAAGKKKAPKRDNYTAHGWTKEQIRSKMLSLFDEHEYWTIEEMYHKLELPKDAFKPILRELAENVTFEGKQKWHLKGEYR